MPSSRNANFGRPGGLLRLALGGLLFATTVVSAQTSQIPAPKKAAGHHANEMTLAALRPGKDTVGRATRLYGKTKPTKDEGDGQFSWRDACNRQSLTIESDHSGKIQELRTALIDERGVIVDCGSVPQSKWKTGLGLRVWDESAKVLQIYGEPDSKSPSTRDGQPLELWYYAFDWAGPDVPQVMEVLCTREKQGQPGRVVEITLAAPSL